MRKIKPMRYLYKAKAVDTNGAGDMFAGGVIHGLSEDWENAESVRFGNFLASKGLLKLDQDLKKISTWII